MMITQNLLCVYVRVGRGVTIREREGWVHMWEYRSSRRAAEPERERERKHERASKRGRESAQEKERETESERKRGSEIESEAEQQRATTGEGGRATPSSTVYSARQSRLPVSILQRG